jgi:putative addiction module component (TIGR02574 family)
MKHSDFRVGVEFFTATGKWRCTDLGRRTVIAIRLDHREDVSWYNGPPYAVEEIVFDEYDLGGCQLDAVETNGTTSRAFADVWKKASELPDKDRAALATLLIESLDEGEPDPDAEAAWAVEIQRRLDQVNAGTVESIPWEVVRQRVRDQLKAARRR